MPLEPGQSKAALSHNIATEREAGKSEAQSVAIAFSEQRKDEQESETVKRAAGVLFVGPTGRVLLMRRAVAGSDHRAEWACPGGGIEAGETAEEAARREVFEETGFTYEGPLALWTRRIRDNVDFTTFLARIDADGEFAVQLNEEHDFCKWMSIEDALVEPSGEVLLHPGVRTALKRFSMDEMAVAEAIRDEELVSPQRFGNMLLVAMRITGTGAAYRRSLDEYVWRDPQAFSTDRFLERCKGLPVILEHPPKQMDSEQFNKRMVGTCVIPWRRQTERGLEVWCIGKIWDEKSQEDLQEYPFSTSPGVSFSPLDDTSRVLLGGVSLFIEGAPYHLDHLALLPPKPDGSPVLGVWDKRGAPTGVESAPVDDRLDDALRDIQISNLCSKILN